MRWLSYHRQEAVKINGGTYFEKMQNYGNEKSVV